LNLGSIRPGKSNTIQVDVLNSRGEAITEDVDRFPAQVTITPTLTPAKPARSILISPRYSGQPAPGFRVAAVEIVPNEVVVQGDRNRIARLSVLETEPIAIDGLKQTASRSVNLRLPDGVSVQNKLQQVRVTIRIEPDASSASPPRGP
jgi:YbbR domain-containing protein